MVRTGSARVVGLVQGFARPPACTSALGGFLTTTDVTRRSHTASVPLRTAGWALHLYTASGTVLALLAVIAVFDGHTVRALWILLIALAVDGTDGMLARALRVKETIPTFDGARLDDIVDYITYAFVPMLLLWAGDYLPHGFWGKAVAAIPLVASSYQFCRSDAKTDDHFFLGFPSYWNVVAFYVVVLELSTTVTVVILLACAALVFVPIKYVYPSRTDAFWVLNLSLAALWLVLYGVILATFPDPNMFFVGLSLAYVAYYVAVSVYLTMISPRRRARQSAGAPAQVD
jgi:phosphatidylcholine synthase